ncbi:hypothetical protein [Sphingomonas sp. PWP1-2]|uniref:hypothetical protein n=1 Tax=Sphingomonas sp. PWP1-2 TaxID=2804558 RepID=UPI003CEECFCF
MTDYAALTQTLPACDHEEVTLPDLAAGSPDPRQHVLKLLSTLRRDRGAILKTYVSPLDFCLAVIDPDHAETSAAAARVQLVDAPVTKQAIGTPARC